MSLQECAERMYEVLKAALSSNAEQRQMAEEALREAEQRPDYFASLAMIAVANEEVAEEQVRWLAAVCGKNAVPRSWRLYASRKRDAKEEERDFVRNQLLSGIGEKDSKIATQISVWIASVARIDFPQYWPPLLADLGDAIRSEDQALMFRALVTLDMVLKQVGHKRLIGDRQAMMRIAPKLFSILWDVFMRHLQALLQNQDTPEALQLSFRVLERCMKSFRRLLLFACPGLDHIPQCQELFAKIIELPDVFLRGARGGTEVQVRLSLLAAKLIRATHEKHPIQFQPLLMTFLPISYQTIIEFDSSVSSDRTCYHLTSFLRNTLDCTSYDISIATAKVFKEQILNGIGQPQGVSGEACRYAVLSFFDENKINTLIEAMVSKIFILNDGELDAWVNDPEALVREEEAASWGMATLRHESEHLFKNLLLRERPRLIPMVLQLTESVSTDQPLLLDACYRAVGQAVFDVKDIFAFEEWLNGRLGSLLNASTSTVLGERILKARAVWLVGKFAQQLSREIRRQLAPMLVKLMNSLENDLIVALTAANAVRAHAEDVGFHAGDFSPLLEECLVSYFRLVCRAETFETKQDLLTGIVELLGRFRAKFVIPHIDLIATAVPELWEQCRRTPQQNVENSKVLGDTGIGAESLLRIWTISLLVCVVRNTGDACFKSAKMRQVLFRVIDFATEKSDSKGGRYMDEGLELWNWSLLASSEYLEEFSAIFPRVIAILGDSLEYLKEVISILRGYCMLGKEKFMTQHGGIILKAIADSLHLLRDRGSLAACELLDVMLQLFPVEGVQFTAELLKRFLEKVVSHTESQVLASTFVAVLARATLVNVGDMERLVLGNSMAGVQLVNELADTVGSQFKYGRRKLLMVALVGLVGRYSQNDEVLQKLPVVFRGVVDILLEEKRRTERKLRGENEGDSGFYKVVEQYEEDGGPDCEEEGSTGEARHLLLHGMAMEKKMRTTDICYTVDLREACMDLVLKIKAHGQERYERALAQTDGNVLQKLEVLLRKDG